MQFRINSRNSGLTEYMAILNKQVMQLNNETKDGNQEIKQLNTKLERIDDSYNKNKINQLCNENNKHVSNFVWFIISLTIFSLLKILC